MTLQPFTDEHKSQPIAEQNAFKLRIAAERKAEEEELKQRQKEEALMRANNTSFDNSLLKKMIKTEEAVEKVKKVKKTRKPRKKRVKKEKKEPISLKIVQPKKLVLPVYHSKIEVNEFNKHKVDYIRKQIHFCKDKRRKTIYENALTKYDLSNYNNLK